MFDELPSLRGFKPKIYVGGPVRFYLPLLYDLSASVKPKVAVVIGFGEGEAFHTLCQAAVESGEESECVAVRRERPGEPESDDDRWREGVADGQEMYGNRARFFPSSAAALATLADGSVDLLFLEDSDSGQEIAGELRAWERKLSRQAVVLLHGINIEREDSLMAAWQEWAGKRAAVSFSAGLGLAMARAGKAAVPAPIFKLLFGRTAKINEVTALYALLAERIDAEARATKAEKASAALQIRQVWLDSLLTDRWKAQEIMDEQARIVAHQGRAVEEQARKIADLENRLQFTLAEHKELKQQFENLHRDRAKAQLVMDGQAEQVKHWIAQAESLGAQVQSLEKHVREQKQVLKAAKAACRKKGRCFQIQTGPKVRRSLGEKIKRELQRLPRNLGLARGPEEPGSAVQIAAAENIAPALDRYESWILENEPDADGLERQRHLSNELTDQPRISLLTPVYNTSPVFLEEMFASVLAQTYPDWELCVVDGGSDSQKTLETLRRWEGRDPRIRVERMPENLGISGNTNRALRMASGDLVAFLDHDDTMPPFALYELARAALANPEADIFYSDEDRLSTGGKRSKPFFKPEWSPELLWSCMYLGHLSAYRRSLTLEIGGFRREFDLSQDYDFALRATERARRIHHIPKVLYHWREHPASGSSGGKPEARQTNLAALADAMRRRNLAAEVLEYPAANRARLKVGRWPRVSVIIPTDSPTRARACFEELPRATRYSDLEILLVTNSELGASLKFLQTESAKLRVVLYDKPFNFSDKCNAGAAAATGDRLIFFNDDVETTQADWIQNLIEPLENPKVGAVAPKLLYETGLIQHAGLVTGVRGLIGTAFHQRPADTTEHVNFAQSLRDVSALSAACLAMRRDDFVRVGGFDAVNTPIAHSDVDLCFKVREAGLRCVYTPFATLRHAGHVSIGATETKSRPPRRDKASIFLLKRWGDYVTHDPYFPRNMRDWLHRDSPTPIRMHAPRNAASAESSPDLLFISHDLTLSGAPMLLLQLAIWCSQNGMFVTVMAPADGSLREEYQAAGIPIIIDPLCETGHESFKQFARDFDCVLANTVRTEAAVRAAHAANVPVIWWVHETQVGEHYLREEAKLRSALPLADAILAPAERTAAVYRAFSEAIFKVSHYGIPDVRAQLGPAAGSDPNSVQFLLLGSIEPRKGQDIFIEAVASLPEAVRGTASFRLLGRVMDSEFGSRIAETAAGLANVAVEGECDHREALEAIERCNVLVCASRDEALPVTILEALSLGKAVISANVGGIAEALTDGEDALVVRPDDPRPLAAAMERLIKDPKLVEQLGKNGRATFETKFGQDRFGTDFRELVAEVIGRRP